MYIKTESHKIGDSVVTQVEHKSCAGTFTVGSIVSIIGIGERGYDIQDSSGNRMLEIGWEV